jgi:chromosome segregation ATPase
VKTYVELACPGCQRSLRIRTEYLGGGIRCNHCQHVFKALARDGQVAAAAPVATPALARETARQPPAPFEAELRKAQAEIAGRTADHTRAAQEARQARDEAARLTEQLQTLRHQADQTAARLQELQDTHTEALAAHGELVQRHEEAQARWERERQELHQQCEQLRGVQGQQAEDRQKLDAFRQEHDLEKTGWECELAAARAEVVAFKQDRARLAAQCRKLEEAQQHLHDECAAAQQQRDDQSALVRELRAELVPLQERLKEATVGVPAALGDHEVTSAEVAALQQELATARGTADIIRQRIAELETRAGLVAGLEAELRYAQATIARLQQGGSPGQQELTAARQECERLRSLLAAQQAAPVAAAGAGNAEADALRAERERMVQQIRVLQEELAQFHDRNGAGYSKAVEAAFAGEGWPWSEAGGDGKSPRGQADAQRQALANELLRLQQENVKLRQWLGQFGIYVK